MSIRDIMPWGSARRVPTLRDEHPFTTLQREMNNLFADMTSGFPTVFGGSEGGNFLPKVDVVDHEGSIEVTAELPGIAEKDIQLHISDNTLVLRGEKKQEEKRSEAKGRAYVERHYGSFERVIPLSAEVDEDKVDASFKNGVLSITLPKASPEQKGARKISVRTN